MLLWNVYMHKQPSPLCNNVWEIERYFGCHQWWIYMNDSLYVWLLLLFRFVLNNLNKIFLFSFKRNKIVLYVYVAIVLKMQRIMYTNIVNLCIKSVCCSFAHSHIDPINFSSRELFHLITSVNNYTNIYIGIELQTFLFCEYRKLWLF